MRRILFFLIFLSLRTSVHAQVYYSISNNLEDTAEAGPWINVKPANTDSAFSGIYYSVVDSGMEFGMGYRSEFPQECQHKNLSIVVSQRVRIRNMDAPVNLVFSVSRGDSAIYWISKNLTARVADPNAWQLITDTFDLPASLTGGNNSFAAYVWNPSHSEIHIDDFSLQFVKKGMPSYFPVVNMHEVTSGSDGELINTLGPYRVFQRKGEGIFIMDNNNDTVISGLSIISEWSKKEGGDRLQTAVKRFDLKLSVTGDTIILSGKNDISENTVAVCSSSGSLVLDMKSDFTRDGILWRQALIAHYDLPLKEVLKPSGRSIHAEFADEYWLNKDGFSFGSSDTVYVVYRPELSSIQLMTEPGLLCMNLDYAADHPMLHFPLLKKSEGRFVDYSSRVFKKQDRISGSIRFQPADSNAILPRIQQHPNGYLSAMVWTEHADFADMRTHRAVYYGSESITDPEEATGGFIRYSIPVTKSVFYANPEGTTNDRRAGFLPGPLTSVKETEGFENFLKVLEESGMEICLHTPDPFTTNRKLLEESLSDMRRKFGSPTWIDHGYDNLETSNREDLNCDGAIPGSKSYAADLWEKYGLKYFWNSFYEDSGFFDDYSFHSFFSVPYYGWGEAFPAPTTWRHPSRTGGIVHWGTTGTIDPKDGSLWKYLFDEARLNDLADSRQDAILHCYPARVDSTNGFYRWEDGVIKADPEFNALLARLSSFRSQRKIWLTTVRDLLNYRTSLESLAYETLPGGRIRITNEGRDLIRGLTLSAQAEAVDGGEKSIQSKRVSNELFFWFDLMPGEKVEITLH